MIPTFPSGECLSDLLYARVGVFFELIYLVPRDYAAFYWLCEVFLTSRYAKSLLEHSLSSLDVVLHEEAYLISFTVTNAKLFRDCLFLRNR